MNGHNIGIAREITILDMSRKKDLSILAKRLICSTESLLQLQ